MEDIDSTEVKYKIRQWSLPGAAVPVLNVSSRVFWLELDDKAPLDSYGVLQESILCDVFSQKCSAAWQGARGEQLTVSVMLPGRQDADDWLNFMLSQKNLWPTFRTRGTRTEEILAQAFSKERRRLQVQHLSMVVNLKWSASWPNVRQSTTGKSKEDLDALLYDRVARRNRTDPYDEKKYRGAGLKEAQKWWKTCQDWIARYKTHSEPFIYDIKKLMKVLSDKETVAQLEVDASWRIAQRGSRLEVRTNSSVDVCQTFETHLSTQVQILTWRTSNHRQHGRLLHGGREHLRSWEERFCFTLLHLV